VALARHLGRQEREEHSRAISARAITTDPGEEWRVLRDAEPRRALRWDEAIAWLEALPDAAPSSRPGV
jgi:hypothetical protein